MGKMIKTEKLSYKGWQKRLFGKSVGYRAPGMFVEILRRKAGSAGGEVNEFPVKNKLSQTCHCGQVHKKKLSERWSYRDCGVHTCSTRSLFSLPGHECGRGRA
jgi:transposase